MNLNKNSADAYISLHDTLSFFPEDNIDILQTIEDSKINYTYRNNEKYLTEKDFKCLKNTIYLARNKKELTISNNSDDLISFDVNYNANEEPLLKSIYELSTENSRLTKELSDSKQSYNTLLAAYQKLELEHLKTTQDLIQCIKDNHLLTLENKHR
ncbi:hypothetical protein ACSW8S_20160 (plasmid) [Clostridium perfringens]